MVAQVSLIIHVCTHHKTVLGPVTAVLVFALLFNFFTFSVYLFALINIFYQYAFLALLAAHSGMISLIVIGIKKHVRS